MEAHYSNLDGLPSIIYGGDYNPEQWSQDIWLEDMRLMQEARVNLVSLGIFSWARLEPRQGQYDFGWLDTIMDMLHQHGIRVNLATATASPPAWLSTLHPEMLPVTGEGVRLWPGARQHYCPSSPIYRQTARKLVEQIARRYKDHPALAMWHVNNEYGCHVAQCYCDVSAVAFRQWLQRRYGSIEALNDAWGTAFWSQQYGGWEEILPPRSAPTFGNPTQSIDFERFSSDALLECFEIERSILKEVTPAVPVTTNFLGFLKSVDYWKWAGREDIVANDSYPDPLSPLAQVEGAACSDLMRSLGRGNRWLLMEQTSSKVNWRSHNAIKRPGQMRLWSYQALARGGRGIMFFQWRASQAGAEKFHGGMVEHSGTQQSRVWREVKALGSELAGLAQDKQFTQARVKADVAILFDWENWWALEQQAHPSSSLKMLELLAKYYGPLYRRNITVDFVNGQQSLDGYRLLLVPNLYQVEAQVADNLKRFVRQGGMLVMSFFSGIVDKNDHIYLGGYPAPFRDLLGIRIEEFEAQGPDQMMQLDVMTQDGRVSYQCDSWSDVIDLEGASAVGNFAGGWLSGRPALTHHQFGQGVAYYLGTQPEPACMDWLLQHVCQQASVQPVLTVPEGVEAVRQQAADRVYLFLLNHTLDSMELDLPAGAYRELISGKEQHGKLQLEAYGVAVLQIDQGKR